MNEKSLYSWRENDPVICPTCGSDNVAKIIYGEYDLTDELKEMLRAGIISLGGNKIDKDNPIYVCNSCYKRWGRLADDEDSRDLFDWSKASPL